MEELGSECEEMIRKKGAVANWWSFRLGKRPNTCSVRRFTFT